MRLTPVHMEYLYGTSFPSQSSEAYERLILDALRGDPTLFTRSDEVEAQWRIVDPILKAWASPPEPPSRYRAGSSAPDPRAPRRWCRRRARASAPARSARSGARARR